MMSAACMWSTMRAGQNGERGSTCALPFVPCATRCVYTAARMTPFADASEVQNALEALANRPEGALVVQLPREPGRRDSRYLQLFTGPPAAELLTPAPVSAAASPSHSHGAVAEYAPAAASSDLDARLAQLELAVSELRTQIEQLRDAAAARG